MHASTATRRTELQPADTQQGTPSPDPTEAGPTLSVASTRAIDAEPQVLLARVIAFNADGSLLIDVTARGQRQAQLDPSVDRSLIAQCIETGARVVLESGDPPTIVGVLATQRTLTIDPHGDVIAKLRNLRVEVEQGLLLRAPKAFLQLDREGAVELFGERLIHRARKVAKILAAHISLN